MRKNTSELKWTLTGYIPFEWELGHCFEIGAACKSDIDTIPASVPGSVQKALLDAGQISDWNTGLSAKQAEWVENRHWLYETRLPIGWFESGKRYKIKCLGLDHKGSIYLNGKCIYDFSNCHLEHSVEITSFLNDADNLLQILFECPPRWLGQFGRSSKIRDWKPRFYYTWDWVSRVVQVGVWDDIFIEQIPDNSVEDVQIHTDYDTCCGKGCIFIKGAVCGSVDTDVRIRLYDGGSLLFSGIFNSDEFVSKRIEIKDLDIIPWWPSNTGGQKLYLLKLMLTDKEGGVLYEYGKTIGFKNIKWRPCLDAPKDADPWICSINGTDIFLQGVNWTPIRPNFADVCEEQYRKRLQLYKSLGFNVLRVWGGATLEKRCFYDICDELGLLIWQDMPLSSSGIENYPPDDDEMVEQYLQVVRSYISRLHHHISILLWCGGNELTDIKGIPLGFEHPMFGRANEMIKEQDPWHRFIATTPSGPSFTASADNYGKGCHWDVHGPWKVQTDLDQKWEDYWQNDDSLFRSEVGAPGPSSSQLIRKYAGDCDVMPEEANPLWRRTGWWLELAQYIKENGCKPVSLEDYVKWGQIRQADILCKAVSSCKRRFPRCGGIILWMGHDSFPCAANTSIIDFEGNPKHSAIMLSKILLSPD